VHPLRMQPRDGTEAIKFYFSSPFDEAYSPDGTDSQARSQKEG
jgi:hypothetical protein